MERDQRISLKENEKLSECLSSIFCLADLYNPDSDREEYELDDKQLYDQVLQLINKLRRLKEYRHESKINKST
ncbi:hypothetical protein B7R74_02275 [Yersinia pseudotuberculosis]|uniref:colicin immunity domain-containing protein n=1 Tax=Yersinia pseudotuberculosis TaxID=633 RepID=UPI000D0ABE1C|nr:hypothetical protein B7R74_02275 [Yersinia pseudotuberculosis]